MRAKTVRTFFAPLSSRRDDMKKQTTAARHETATLQLFGIDHDVFRANPA